MDGTTVWVYVPDAMAGRGNEQDRWLAADADIGTVLAQVELDPRRARRAAPSTPGRRAYAPGCR